MWKEFQAMNPNNDAPPAEIPVEKSSKKTKKTSAKKGDLKIRIKVPKPKKSKKNSSASEDDFEDDLDFMEPEPSKAKRIRDLRTASSADHSRTGPDNLVLGSIGSGPWILE